MIKKILWIMILLLSLYTVSADIMTTSNALTTTGTTTGAPHIMGIVVNVTTYDITIQNASVITNSGATRLIIFYDNWTILANNSIVNYKANFSEVTLKKGTFYYILTDKYGVAYTRAYTNPSSDAFPFTTYNNFHVLSSYDSNSGSNATAYWLEIKSVGYTVLNVSADNLKLNMTLFNNSNINILSLFQEQLFFIRANYTNNNLSVGNGSNCTYNSSDMKASYVLGITNISLSNGNYELNMTYSHGNSSEDSFIVRMCAPQLSSNRNVDIYVNNVLFDTITSSSIPSCTAGFHEQRNMTKLYQNITSFNVSIRCPTCTLLHDVRIVINQLGYILVNQRRYIPYIGGSLKYNSTNGMYQDIDDYHSFVNNGTQSISVLCNETFDNRNIIIGYNNISISLTEIQDNINGNRSFINGTNVSSIEWTIKGDCSGQLINESYFNLSYSNGTFISQMIGETYINGFKFDNAINFSILFYCKDNFGNRRTAIGNFFQVFNPIINYAEPTLTNNSDVNQNPLVFNFSNNYNATACYLWSNYSNSLYSVINFSICNLNNSTICNDDYHRKPYHELYFMMPLDIKSNIGFFVSCNTTIINANASRLNYKYDNINFQQPISEITHINGNTSDNVHINADVDVSINFSCTNDTIIYSNASINYDNGSKLIAYNVTSILIDKSKLYDGNYTVVLGCFDNASHTTNVSKSFSIKDIYMPVITWNSPTSDNGTQILQNTSLFVDFIGSDQNLFSIRLNCFNPLGVNVLNLFATNLTGSTVKQLSNYTLNQTVLGIGFCNVSVKDAHTKQNINTYDIRMNKEIIYSLDSMIEGRNNLDMNNEVFGEENTPDDNNVLSLDYEDYQMNLTVVDADDILIRQKNDRYTFEPEYSEIPPTIEYIILCTSEEFYKVNSEYSAHFICGNLWIDFNMEAYPKKNYHTNYLGHDQYSITVPYINDSSLETESFGIVNEVISTVQYKVVDHLEVGEILAEVSINKIIGAGVLIFLWIAILIVGLVFLKILIMFDAFIGIFIGIYLLSLSQPIGWIFIVLNVLLLVIGAFLLKED